MSTEPPPAPKRTGGNAVLWVIAILLFLILICGSCTVLSLTPIGDAFWGGFLQGLNAP